MAPVLAGRHVVEIPLSNGSYATEIYPDCLNTVRVVTMKDEYGWFLVGAAHRFGTMRSGVVDNFSKGGLAARVDIDTGRMGVAKSALRYRERTDHKFHPDTGSRIDGVMVPNWSEVCEQALQLSALFPSLVHIGWDLAVTERGVVCVEGNAYLPNPNVLQLGGPILRDERTRRLMVKLGVVKRRRAKRIDFVLAAGPNR